MFTPNAGDCRFDDGFKFWDGTKWVPVPTPGERVIVVWDKNGKFFQTWTEEYQGAGIEHGKAIAEKIGGSYQIVGGSKPPETKTDINDSCLRCGKQLQDGPGGGVVCPDKSCGYWFCF